MHLQHLSAYCTYCVLWASVFSVQEAAVRRWETWTTSRTRHQHVTSLSSWLLSLSLVGNYWRASTCNFPGLVTAYCNKGGASNNIAIVQHLHNRSISNTIAIYCSCNILLPGYGSVAAKWQLIAYYRAWPRCASSLADWHMYCRLVVLLLTSISKTIHATITVVVETSTRWRTQTDRNEC